MPLIHIHLCLKPQEQRLPFDVTEGRRKYMCCPLTGSEQPLLGNWPSAVASRALLKDVDLSALEYQLLEAAGAFPSPYLPAFPFLK